MRSKKTMTAEEFELYQKAEEKTKGFVKSKNKKTWIDKQGKERLIPEEYIKNAAVYKKLDDDTIRGLYLGYTRGWISSKKELKRRLCLDYICEDEDVLVYLESNTMWRHLVSTQILEPNNARLVASTMAIDEPEIRKSAMLNLSWMLSSPALEDRKFALQVMVRAGMLDNNEIDTAPTLTVCGNILKAIRREEVDSDSAE